MALQFKNDFNKGVNLDLDATRLPPDAAVFIKNLTDNVNTNAGAPALSGSNARVRTPLEGNQALTQSGMPAGTNYTICFYSSEQTNEGYFAVYNRNNSHTIWVIRGDTGAVQKVHQNTLLPFILDPSFFLSEGRMTLELVSTMDPVTNEETNFKLLVFTNNRVLQCLIDVEASIATNSYSTGYFTSSAAFYNRLELIHLGATLPIKCVKLNDPTPYTPAADDASKQNLLINAGWQFRIRTWDIWGRPSDWGIISSVYTSIIGGGCIASSNGLPRCVNLCFDAGNPLIKFITVAYRRGVGNDPSGQTETDWFEHETFRKYDDSTGVQWYQRPLNPIFTTSGSGITINAGTNIITYTFCADKGSNPVDPNEAALTQPGLARWSGSVFSISKSMGLANNVYAFEPISQDVIDAVEFSVKVPDEADVPCPAAELQTITVYANLYNAFFDYSPLLRATFGIYTFGDANNPLPPNSISCNSNNFATGQVFGDQTNPGFIAYLAGTPYKVIGEWGDYDPVSGVFTVNSFPWSGSFAYPHIKMTRFTFVDIPRGKYVVRLASHHATINDGDLQKTSTQLAGIGVIQDAQAAWARRTAIYTNPLKEMLVDCSAGDVNLGALTDPMFIILDYGAIQSNAIDGYLFEEQGGNPVEMAPVAVGGLTLGSPVDGIGTVFTDHNGFFSGASVANQVIIDIYSSVCDSMGTGLVWTHKSGCQFGSGQMVHGDGNGSRSPDYYGNFGNWKNQVYIARATRYLKSYPDGGRRHIRQKITICDDVTIGVPGIPVVMTKCQPSLTNSSGIAILIAHNRYNYIAALTAGGAASLPFNASLVPDYSTSPINQDLLIFSQRGGCEWNVCGTCDTSRADITIAYLDCDTDPVGCTDTQPKRTLCLIDLTAQANGVGIFGIQAGSKIPVAFWVHDVIHRHTAPQIRMGDLGYVFFPNLNDTTPSPFPAMALCSLQVTIPGGLVIDPVFTQITFLVGSNCLFRDYFSWPADWVQYIDNTGATNTTNPTAIRIYFQSLNEYNKQYNFATNVAWDFISKSNTAGETNDIVQFIMNGDGSWLPPVKGAAVTYDKFGSFFTIDYQPELAGLQNGCLFRVVRPKQNTTGVNLPYYEQCLTLDITNGVLPSGTWDIPYQDSYLLTRSIPVPLLKGETGPISPGGSAPGIQYTSVNQDAALATSGYSENNINNSNGVVIFQVEDYQTSFPFFFESPSPADLWGSHLQSRGRVGIPNPYEKQYRIGTEIAMSNPIADRGIVNGIGTYLAVNRQVFDRNTWGDITAVLAETSTILVICDRDHFIVNFNASTITLKDGVLTADREFGIFTAPKRKAGTNYGCSPLQINTIRKYAGIVRWLDNTGYLVIHNFSAADSNTDDAGYLGYLLNKIAIVNIANNGQIANGQTYFLGGIDPKTYEYYLSSFNIPTTASPSYINTDSQPVLAHNETLVFDLKTSLLKGFASFTPEYYGIIPGYFLQRQFLSFKNGKPYIHHNSFVNNVAPPAYCNFFGTQCEVRITHVVNGVDGKLLPDKVKRFLYTELYCKENIPVTGAFPEALFYADVITSEKGQTSRLLVARWTLRDGYQCAAYICDINTPADPNIPVQTGAHAILDGNQLQGRWLQVSLTNNPAWPGSYFEVSSTVSYIDGVEKSAD